MSRRNFRLHLQYKYESWCWHAMHESHFTKMRSSKTSIILALVGNSLLITNLYASEILLPEINYLENDEWGCQIYLARPSVFAPGVIQTRVFQTCNAPLKFGSAGYATEEYRSAFNDYRVDCKAQTYAYIGSQTFDQQFWRQGNAYSKASTPYIFRPIDLKIRSALGESCKRARSSSPQ